MSYGEIEQWIKDMPPVECQQMFISLLALSIMEGNADDLEDVVNQLHDAVVSLRADTSH
jgi:hypothetical protein